MNEEQRWQYAPSQSFIQGRRAGEKPGTEALRVPFEAPAYLFRRFNQDLEVAVEAAIQGGEHGVLVVWTGARYEISISPEVKYGQIVERTEPWTL